MSPLPVAGLLDPASLPAGLLGGGAVGVATCLRSGRRRRSLNGALHELRRPAQILALSDGRAGGTVGMLLEALDELDLRLNGGAGRGRREKGVVDLEALARTAIRRWADVAAAGGVDVELATGVARARVLGRAPVLSAALDNLILNSIEHGGPLVRVSIEPAASGLRIVVSDRGRRPPTRRVRGLAAAAARRARGRSRHGHGLAAVRRAARQHGGRFTLKLASDGAMAVVDLPVVTA